MDKTRLFSPEEIKDRQARLMEKYSKTGIFDKRDYDVAELTETQKIQLATLLENTAFETNQERLNKGLQPLNEVTTTAQVRGQTTFQFPLIRRVFPNLVAQNLVSVQVLPQPSGVIYYMDTYYDTDVAPIKRGTRNDLQYDQGRTINDARYYSAGRARGAVIGVGDGSTTQFVVPRFHTPYADTKFTPVHPNANLQVYVDSVARVVKFEGTPTGSEVLVVYQTGDVVFATAPSTGAQVTMDYDLRFEGDDSRIPEMNFDIHSEYLQTSVRKMKARWTIEAEQDLQAYWGLSAERELSALVGGEISREIDREIMFDLLGAASENVNWSAAWPGSASGYSRSEYNETFIDALYQVEARIFNKRQKAPNWIIAGTDVTAKLQSMNGMYYSGDAQGGTVGEGPRRQGTFRDRYTIITDPLFPKNKLLMGYKGTGMQDAGYIYAPYIGLQATDTFMDPNDWTPRKGWMRRDGKKLISNDFYATLTITS